MATKTRVSLEEFLALGPCEPELELMDGEVIQKAMVGKKHSRLVARLVHLLMSHMDRTQAGDVDTELRHLFREAEWVFLPDVSVTLRERLADVDVESCAAVEVMPDFAIEVLSPDDRPGRVARKVTHYMQAGVRLLWVVDPDEREITVWRAGEAPIAVTPPGTLDGAPVLPDLVVDLDELFAALPAKDVPGA